MKIVRQSYLKLESAVRIKEEPTDIVSVDHSQSVQVWLCRGRYVLTIYTREGNDTSRRAIE